MVISRTTMCDGKEAIPWRGNVDAGGALGLVGATSSGKTDIVMAMTTDPRYGITVASEKILYICRRRNAKVDNVMTLPNWQSKYEIYILDPKTGWTEEESAEFKDDWINVQKKRKKPSVSDKMAFK